jgi:hypothetical protein
MRWALIPPLLLISILQATLPLQPALPTDTSRSQITIEIRNGKTGGPVWIASPYVFLGTPDPNKFEESYRRTKFWSDAHVDVSGVEPREVRVWVDFTDRDCRYAGDYKDFQMFYFGGETLKRMPFYDIDKILSTGIVTANLCGAKTKQPRPGVLTIYVIPATFKELWNS